MSVKQSTAELELIILTMLEKGEFTYHRRSFDRLMDHFGATDVLAMPRTLGVLAREAYIVRLSKGSQVTYRILTLGRERLEELQAEAAA